MEQTTEPFSLPTLVRKGCELAVPRRYAAFSWSSTCGGALLVSNRGVCEV